jgi:hypothetical protein
MIQVVCAWHPTPLVMYTRDDGRPGVRVSHGICPECAEKLKREHGRQPITGKLVEPMP